MTINSHERFLRLSLLIGSPSHTVVKVGLNRWWTSLTLTLHLAQQSVTMSISSFNTLILAEDESQHDFIVRSRIHTKYDKYQLTITSQYRHYTNVTLQCCTGLLVRPEHRETKVKTETRECKTETETKTLL